jgi:hypothetical protein
LCPRPGGIKVSLLAQAAFFAAALCLVTVVVNFFVSWGWLELVVGSVAIGALAYVLFAVVLNGVVTFLRHRWLMTLAKVHIPVAAVYAVIVLAACLAYLGNDVNFRVEIGNTLMMGVQLLTVLVGAFVLYLLQGASAALQRAQQGLPVEGPLPTKAGEGTEGEVALVAGHRKSDKPEPLPEHFAFSESDVEGFQAQDSTAGKAIVALMTGVFCIGVILYTIIAMMAAF